MKKKKKGLAIGNSDFKEIIQENGYYIDKTKFIEDLLEDLSKVKLFTKKIWKNSKFVDVKIFF
ncbi:AAA family ATPase [Leptotrichia sp. HSP-334]|uniref:AAA family ATPase n=1 Tax=Leptotrichia rugosa TaxID=3239302 RepID=A0AB39VD43_9FUSO